MSLFYLLAGTIVIICCISAFRHLCFFYYYFFAGDLKNEISVLSWLLSSDNRELDDAIEAVNMKMLNKLLQSTPLMAVFFCKNCLIK